MIYKVTAMITGAEPWYMRMGKAETQWKKKIYINYTKFQTHSPKLIERWTSIGCEVLVFQSEDGENWKPYTQ